MSKERHLSPLTHSGEGKAEKPINIATAYKSPPAKRPHSIGKPPSVAPKMGNNKNGAVRNSPQAQCPHPMGKPVSFGPRMKTVMQKCVPITSAKLILAVPHQMNCVRSAQQSRG
eukprot:4059522-Karenia_brevis.AAC.1